QGERRQCRVDALGDPRPGGPVLPCCQMPEGVSEHLVAPVVPAAAGHDGDLLLAGALAASRVWEGERDALVGDVSFEQPTCNDNMSRAYTLSSVTLRDISSGTVLCCRLCRGMDRCG